MPPPLRVNPSTAIATVVVDELVANGVTDAVLSPGSRNAPLSMALHAADAAGSIRLHVRIDERTAGFLALGLAKAGGRPVPVVTTSGTAVANLHPAVVEADLSETPLLVLSADRPPWMRDVGANQVIDQTRLFGSALRFFHEFETPGMIAGQNSRWRAMVCRALGAVRGAGGAPGPAQLNFSFSEPLLPESSADVWPEPITGRGTPWTAVDAAPPAGPLIPAPRAGERCLVIAEMGSPLAQPLAAAGHLVISEAGPAGGRSLLAAGLHLLADSAFLAPHRPERVIVLGRPTLHRPITRLLTDPSVAVDLIGSARGWRGLAGNVRRVGAALDGAAAAAVTAVLDASPLSVSPALADAVLGQLPSDSNLVVGSSQPARDLALGARPGKRVRLLANRGAAGIDGTVSTAVGAALAFPGPTAAYLGDLTLLHDLTGLILGPAEPRPDLIIVVSNNDGGGIFATLESGEPSHAAAFERVFGTPHGTDLPSLARGAGAAHTLVSTRAELAAAFAAGPAGLHVVEVRTDRAGLRETVRRIRSAVGVALGG